jgi:hypothetical protein
MIGLQTERAAATVTEDSTEEKAVARARVDVVTDAVMLICKLGYWIAGGSIGHLKTRKASRKRLVMVPAEACVVNSSASQRHTTITFSVRFKICIRQLIGCICPLANTTCASTHAIGMSSAIVNAWACLP